MPESFVQVAPDSTGKKLRTYQKVVEGQTVEEQYVIQAGFPTFYFQSADNALAGSATNHLFDIFNASGSGLVLKVRKLFLQNTYSVQTGVAAVFSVERTSTVGTGGAVITGVRSDTADAALPAQVTARSNSTAGATGAGQLARLGMLIGEETDIVSRWSWATNILAEGNETKDVTLRAGEGLKVVKTTGAAATSGTWSILAVVTTV